MEDAQRRRIRDFVALVIPTVWLCGIALFQISSGATCCVVEAKTISTLAIRLEMPVQGSIKSAKEMENYFNSELTEKLKRVGLTTAGFERIFRVRQGEGKKPKPDISFANG